MRPLIVVLISVLFLVEIQSKDVHRGRQGRWFERTYTETKVQKEIVTSLVPSSCVHVEATLPPCKSVRSLWSFPEFGGKQILPNFISNRQLMPPANLNNNPQQIVLAPIDEPKSVGWGEYLGLVAPTITVTAIDLHTTTVADPRTVVTFSVKGCRPSKLPLDLNRCGFAKEESGLNIAPTKIFNNIVQPTILPNEHIDVNKLKSVEIEPSTSDASAPIDLSSVPTEILGQVKH